MTPNFESLFSPLLFKKEYWWRLLELRSWRWKGLWLWQLVGKPFNFSLLLRGFGSKLSCVGKILSELHFCIGILASHLPFGRERRGISLHNCFLIFLVRIFWSRQIFFLVRALQQGCEFLMVREKYSSVRSHLSMQYCSVYLFSLASYNLYTNSTHIRTIWWLKSNEAVSNMHYCQSFIFALGPQGFFFSKSWSHYWGLSLTIFIADIYKQCMLHQAIRSTRFKSFLFTDWLFFESAIFVNRRVFLHHRETDASRG